MEKWKRFNNLCIRKSLQCICIKERFSSVKGRLFAFLLFHARLLFIFIGMETIEKIPLCNFFFSSRIYKIEIAKYE